MDFKVNQNPIGQVAPIPDNEMDRLLAISSLDIDYTEQQRSFNELVKLAAIVAGTSISLVNIIDSITQWTVSGYGMETEQTMREDSVCQYTIMGAGPFEIKDLSADARFSDKPYVNGDPNVRYYYGIPLNIGEGMNVGALCVMDQQTKVLDPEKIELLNIIANEIVGRLKMIQVVEGLKTKLLESYQNQRKVAHDIRGPLGGIVGLASIIEDQGQDNRIEEVLEFINLIHKSGNSLLDLADEILGSEKGGRAAKIGTESNAFNLLIFKDKLEKLYLPQAVSKKIRFDIVVSPNTETVPFSKNKLLQIAGNVISNSMKFTPLGGRITVNLDLFFAGTGKSLSIEIKDTGVGLTESEIKAILDGDAVSKKGTAGELGYGYGLALVKHLVESLNGFLTITSEPGNGTTFTIRLPIR
ncbi:Sensor histidine kinase RcsC [Dyadobacter sp. CECT 9275]|uniref:histidine kinase n=1 Tax=Dyadobacter helix TaxID=2822344 RepID=A0A916JE59_9BACT|nr:GAF domain-containing sensor histidine kinase [Dyadobacter sp. CECT 9275]CAG5003060.1 Sensor histidine kinase RcsC [Dyadobacter sp. CECT 9275]